MTKFIFKNAMALVALAIAGTTLMSFGLADMENQWFPVNPTTGQISSVPLDGEPTDNCVIEEPAPTCAVELPSNHTYNNISQVPSSAPKAGRVD